MLPAAKNLSVTIRRRRGYYRTRRNIPAGAAACRGKALPAPTDFSARRPARNGVCGMRSFAQFVSASTHYRPGDGMAAFVLHRISGLAVLLFLSIHIVDTSMVYLYPQGYEEFLAVYRSPLFMLAEIALMAGVIYHGLNGFRIALFDLVLPAAWTKSRERFSVRLTILLAAILWLPAGLIMGGNFIGYTFLGWK
jgi:succinate dehydrogenase / fumarate reductase cytochrome b subunit